MRYIILLCILIITALFLLRSHWERRQLSVTSYTVPSPAADRDLKVVFLSDIHDRLDEKSIAEVTDAVFAQKPDIIILGGDTLTVRRDERKSPDIDTALMLVRMLEESCHVPIIHAEGNHEMRLRKIHPEVFAAYISGLRDLGVYYLLNDHVVFGDFAIYGIALDDACYRRKCLSIRDAKARYELPENYFPDSLGPPEEGCYNILLVHSPLYLKEAERWGADLVLSGHFHGGTVRLPVLGGLMTPQFHFFLRETFGFFRLEKTVMIVSRGIGTHSVRLRFGNLPELTLVNIKKQV